MTFLQSNYDRPDAQDVVEHPYMSLYESVLLPSGPFPEVSLSQAPTSSQSLSIGQPPLSQAPIVKLEPTAVAKAVSQATTTRTNTRDRNDCTRVDGTNAQASATQRSAAPTSTASDATDKDEEEFEDVLTLLHRDDFNLDGLDDEEKATMIPPCVTATTETKKPATTETESATETKTKTAMKKPIAEIDTIVIDDDDDNDDDLMEPVFTNDDRVAWMEMFEDLLIYKSRHMGSTAVPLHYRRNRLLGPWIRRQRQLLKYNKIPPEFRSLLTKVVDFECTEWKQLVARSELEFHYVYEKIVENKKNHRTAEDPSKDTYQRMNRIRKQRDWMDPKHKRLLNKIGFQWEPTKEKCHNNWMKMYDVLKQYKKEHSGSVRVPSKYVHEPITLERRKGAAPCRLGYWVSVQRQRYTQNRLQRYRVELLNQVGFVWDANVREERMERVGR